MATTIASGLGGFTAIVAQPTYGASFVTPTRTLTFKTNTFTQDPHPVQGGPYLAGGRVVDIGSARILTYLDAKGSLTGDVVNIGHALLFATAMGSAGTLTQVGTTAAYKLGGASGITLGAPDANNGGSSGCCFDMQLGVTTASDGVQHPVNFHSCMITKATYVFDRTGLVTYQYDWDAQYVETSTSLITPSYPAGPVPFSFANTNSTVKAGALGSEAVVDGIRKATIEITHKLDTTRIYLGNQYKDLPVTNGLIDIDVTLDTDYTAGAKTALFDLFIAGTAVPSLVCTAVGGAIGSSGVSDTFQLNPTDLYVDSGADPTLAGPDLVKNQIKLKGKIDAAADAALKGALFSADTTF